MDMLPEYRRPIYKTIRSRVAEPRRFIQVIAGARQVGKTTLVRQLAADVAMPVRYASADEPMMKGNVWVAQQWEAARLQAATGAALLVLDEIQKITGWAETVKRLWDEDTATGRQVQCILLGSAPLLMQRGMTESLAGRFEVLTLPHWSAEEMREAFGWSVDEYVFHGGYPGAAPLIGDVARWRNYVRDALIESSISRDILMLTRVDKPALLRQLFETGCQYSGQILSYTKLVGQLQDAGNTTTLAHYLELLRQSALLMGLQKYAGQTVRRRASSPKFQVFNNALITAQSGLSFEDARKDPALWGRLTESAVGAHLINAAATGTFEVFYWREGGAEVDFVLRTATDLIALEVKSGRMRDITAGSDAFRRKFHPTRQLLIGGDGIPVEDFLSNPAEHWLTG
jgi:predicted AAA+ superfamily ATPase